MSSPENLPRHLRTIKSVWADPEAKRTPLYSRLRERLSDLPWFDGPPEAEKAAACGGHALYLKHYKGAFLRFCPGTRVYNCCGYRILHIGENCPVGCSYCILQAYFQDQVLKVWANQEDLFKELDAAFRANPALRYRVGTGEFTDSLALERLTGYSTDLVGFLTDYPNVRLELKSKVVDLSWLDAARNPELVLPAWSLNAPAMTRKEEGLASSLEERLSAAKECAALGFKVCLHFDPILHYPGWDNPTDGYPAIVDMIFDYLRPEDIAYMSLGSFRFMPDLKAAIERSRTSGRGPSYLYNEFINGMDNKQRLLRPLRVAQYRQIVHALRRHGFDPHGNQLYFCMESDEVWKAVLDRTPGGTGGLTEQLMEAAFRR